MDIKRSLEILGLDCSQEYVENLAAAFRMFKVLNTPAENEKLLAAEFALDHWKTFSYQATIAASQQKKKGAA